MEIFNVIAGICSIASLVISIFVASRVVKISNSNNDNTGEILTGDGVQKIAKDNSVIADGGSTYIDYREATIIGEVDEPPILTEDRYPVLSDECFGYSESVADSLCRMLTPGNANNYCFLVDFSSIVSKPEMNRWIGYTIQSLPMSDWRTFVNEDYALEFQYMAEGDIRYINLEITNANIGKKLCKRKLDLFSDEQKFCLPLGKYIKSVEDWKSVNEICFVFFPEECVGQKGSVFITDVVLKKDD